MFGELGILAWYPGSSCAGEEPGYQACAQLKIILVLHPPLKVQEMLPCRHDLLPTPPCSKKQQLSSSEQRRQYKAKLSYKREWEKKCPWVICKDSSKGMFCTICQKWDHPTAGSRGAWTSKGVTDWSHVTELSRAHGESRCHIVTCS